MMTVTCATCGRRHDMRDPEVRYHPACDTWSCAGEAACLLRRAEAAPVCGAPNADPDGQPCQRPPHNSERRHAAIKVEEWD